MERRRNARTILLLSSLSLFSDSVQRCVSLPCRRRSGSDARPAHVSRADRRGGASDRCAGGRAAGIALGDRHRRVAPGVAAGGRGRGRRQAVHQGARRPSVHTRPPWSRSRSGPRTTTPRVRAGRSRPCCRRRLATTGRTRTRCSAWRQSPRWASVRWTPAPIRALPAIVPGSKLPAGRGASPTSSAKRSSCCGVRRPDCRPLS